uniref:Uncharacterized protein n=1 Tax=Oryza meridionalis TaxID=40149 RepID=A0A0E0C3R9_9ORYZ
MDATLVCSPECLLDTHFPDGKPQSLHAVLRRAFMAFAGLDQEEAINQEAEDAHHDFFPLQAQPVLDSPCNPHPLGRPLLPRSHIGLNDIDHGGRQVWADTRYGVAATPSWAPHAAIDVYEADALAVVDPVSGVQGVGSWSTRSSIGGSRPVQVQQQQQPASNFQDNILLLSGDLIANAGREETIVYEADPDALAVVLVDDPLVDEVLTIDAGDMEALFEIDQSKPFLRNTRRIRSWRGR